MDPTEFEHILLWGLAIVGLTLCVLAVFLVAYCCYWMFNKQSPPNQFHRVSRHRAIPRYRAVPEGHRRQFHRHTVIRGHQELLQFRSFVQHRVIPGFAGQRQEYHDQFAVLLLIPESELNSINHVIFQPHCSNQHPFVNNANFYYPNRSCYGNYVAARPGQVHSEITLLEELPHLWKAFQDRYRGVPSYIILYSWLMPCPDCTQEICWTLQGTRFENTPVIVAYTTDWIEYSRVENQKSRDKLQAAEIHVEHVKYQEDLPPAQER